MMNIMTIRVPDELQIKLKKYAENQGLTRNALVLQILWAWIADNPNNSIEELLAEE